MSRTLAVFLGVLLIGAAPGQRPARQRASEQQQPLTFGVATRVVEVSVVARDKDGRPVRDLKPEDFQVFDKGQPQSLVSFAIETEESAPPASADAARAQGVFHNQHAPVGGVTVILLDRLNTSWQDQNYARKQVVQFLGQIQPNDRVGLYVLESDTIRVLHDFTSDAGSLLKALARHEARDSAQLAGSEARHFETGDSELDVFLSDTSRMVAAMYIRNRAVITCAALTAIAKHLSSVRGRKNLVWVSSSFPLTFDDPLGRSAGPDRPGSVEGLSTGNVAAEVIEATRAMSEASVAVYPVDARGLLGAWAVNPAEIPSTPNSGRTMMNAFATLQTTMPALDTAKEVAENTGGRAFHSTNDIAGAIRRAFDDARVTYVLGYAPSHDEWDGRFREIRVRVNRPGVEVRHRKGYVAAPLIEKDRKKVSEAIDDALRSPLEASTFAVGVVLERIEGSDEEINLQIRLDPRPITLSRQGDLWSGAVSLLIAQSTTDGKAYKSFDGDVALNNLTAELRERMLTQGVTLNKRVRLRADLHKLHVVAGDPASGVVGSVIIPVNELRAALARR